MLDYKVTFRYKQMSQLNVCINLFLAVITLHFCYTVMYVCCLSATLVLWLNGTSYWKTVWTCKLGYPTATLLYQFGPPTTLIFPDCTAKYLRCEMWPNRFQSAAWWLLTAYRNLSMRCPIWRYYRWFPTNTCSSKKGVSIDPQNLHGALRSIHYQCNGLA